MINSNYILTILLALLFVSCRNETDDIIVDTNDGMYMFILDATKTGYPTDWFADDTIGVTAYISNSTEIYLNGINKRYKSIDKSSFVPVAEEDKILHPLAGPSIDFIACYPYQTGASTTYNISLSEQSNQRQIDLLYSNNAKNKTNVSGNIGLVFNHILSKIIIKVIPFGSLTKEDLYGMNVTIDNVSKEGTFNLADGSIRPSEQKFSIKMITETDSSSSEAIILPGSASGVGFTIELANGNTYAADFRQEQQFLSGHVYTYNVMISQDVIYFSSIEIEGWTGVDNNSQEEIADEIVYKTGDFYPNPNNPKTAIGVIYWLKPGTGGKEGKLISSDSQWRNWGDSNEENLNTSISTGIINWDIVINRNPSLDNFPAFKWCMDKGEGWYLLSRYELHVMNELWSANQEYMNSNLELINGEPFTSDDVYLASSESRSWPNTSAELYYFSNKGWGPILKGDSARIRAVKEF